MDRITAKATPEGTLSYMYYPNGKVQTITSSNPNGASVAYTWDALNRLETVTDNRLSGNNVTSYTYDSANNVATVITPNGLNSTFTYDPLNRLTAMNAGTASYTYQLGLTGNRTQAVESSGRTLNWNYDGIYRLTSETVNSDPENNNGSASYTLDPVGNRLSTLSSLSVVPSGSWTFNADDEISSESYDANGNVIAADGYTYTYDSQNRMISATGNNKVIAMVYDAFGNRVSKTVNGVMTQYLVEDDVNPTGYPQVVDELTNGAVTRTYTYGLLRINENQIINNQWTPSFYVYDGGGNVRQLTNSAGTVTDSYEYDAFGNSFTVSGSTPNNYLYRGEQFDSDLGLYYLRARYYNPATGRFMSRDPEGGKGLDPKSLHKYLYADGDPVNGIDPTGHEALLQFLFTTADISMPVEVALASAGAKTALCLASIALFIKSIATSSLFDAGAGGVLGTICLVVP